MAVAGLLRSSLKLGAAARTGHTVQHTRPATKVTGLGIESFILVSMHESVIERR